MKKLFMLAAITTVLSSCNNGTNEIVNDSIVDTCAVDTCTLDTFTQELCIEEV